MPTAFLSTSLKHDLGDRCACLLTVVAVGAATAWIGVTFMFHGAFA
ncbi:MAG: hypothetical protein V4724_12795 [Pseudomonadota bacterium]